MAAAVAMLSFVVKNTFVSVEEEEEEEMRRSCSQRSSSVPACARLATGPSTTTPKGETEPGMSDDSTDWSDDDLTLEGGQTNSSSCSVCSVELPQRTPLNTRANLYKPRVLPPCVLLPLPPGPLAPNADWAWANNHTPKDAGPPATLEAPPEAAHQKPTRRFRHLCFKAAAAVREALNDYVHDIKDIKIVEGANHWSVIANILPENIGHEEKLRALSKEAIVGLTRSVGKMCVLGYRRKPFTNIPFGFTASLAPVPNKDFACWGAFARGCCTNGDACRWEHPTCASTISVVIRTLGSE